MKFEISSMFIYFYYKQIFQNKADPSVCIIDIVLPSEVERLCSNFCDRQMEILTVFPSGKLTTQY